MFTLSNTFYCAAVQQELRAALTLHYDWSVPGARHTDGGGLGCQDKSVKR